MQFGVCQAKIGLSILLLQEKVNKTSIGSLTFSFLADFKLYVHSVNCRIRTIDHLLPRQLFCH